jgi:CRISPR system Cascade subunit CasE
MSTLHLVEIPIDPIALTAYAVAEGLDDDDQGYALHTTLRRRFGEAGPQPFRKFERGSDMVLYGYCGDPASLLEAAALPSLDHRLDPIFPSPPRCRPMPETWRSGQRLGFDLRARPVVRYGPRARAARGAAGRAPAGERDAFLAALESGSGAAQFDRRDVYRDWLVRTLDPAANVEAAEITAMRRLRVRRSRHANGGTERLDGYEVAFSGIVCVKDPENFARQLAGGVGRHAAFGFGMLLLRPPGRG